MPFQRVLSLREMQTTSSSNWIQFNASISYDDKYYTTNEALISNNCAFFY